ncbi:MAG: hypothetical protein ACU0A2_00390 [Cognatishimia sp.]|uniref:hypothetical protein n=1 Tax=Cognatishimia sp. TaxID=2211648 RepID=UPI004057E33D
MRFLSISALALAFVATTAVADPETYKCEFDAEKAGYWVSSVVYLKIDEGKGEAFVADSLTKEKVNDWYPANLTRASSKRFNLSWKLLSERDVKRQIIHTLRYTLSFDRRNGKGFALMRPQGYSNEWRTKGVCAKSDVPSALR